MNWLERNKMKISVIIIFTCHLILCGNCVAELKGCERYENIVAEYFTELKSLNWHPLKKGKELSSFDAILVCSKSHVHLHTNVPFFSGFIKWKTEMDGKISGELGEDKMLVVGAGSPATVKISEIIGIAYYSNDKSLLKKLHVMEFDFGKTFDNIDKKRREVLQSLKWLIAKKGMRLKPWSLLHTGRNAFAVLQVEKGDIWVNASEIKEMGNEIQIPPNTYVVINPQAMHLAVIKETRNKVFISNEVEKIQEVFSNTYIFQGMEVEN
jgi:hypothetical protein